MGRGSNYKQWTEAVLRKHLQHDKLLDIRI